MTSFVLPTPSNFSFPFACKTLRRGEDDPVNVLYEGSLLRSLNCPDPVLVQIQPGSDGLEVTCLDRKLSTSQKQRLQEILMKGFGFDDPLFEDQSDKKVTCAPLGVHGYFNLYEGIAQIIMGQLVSAKAACSIRKRFINTFGTSVAYEGVTYSNFPNPSVVAEQSVKDLKAVGLSISKAKSLRIISSEFATYDLEQELQKINNSNQLRTHLTQYPGLGRWSSDWISLRGLRRFDIVPAGDLIMRKAFAWYHDDGNIMSADRVDDISETWGEIRGSRAYRIMMSFMEQLQNTFHSGK